MKQKELTKTFMIKKISLLVQKYLSGLSNKNVNTINQPWLRVNHFIAGPEYIRFFIIKINYHFLNMLTWLTIKCDFNQLYLKIVDLDFVKSE